MKRWIKFSSDAFNYDTDLDEFDYDTEDDWFSIYYSAAIDKYVAEGGVDRFEADSLDELASSIIEWNDIIDVDGQVKFDIADNIDYSLEGVKDEALDYGSFVITRYFTY